MVSLFFGIVAQKQPEKFLNIEGINSRCIPHMKKIVKEYNDPNSNRDEVIQKLVKQERFNIGFTGKNLNQYVTLHSKTNIKNGNAVRLFDFYNELRIHRDNQVHPQSFRKSKIPLPKTLDEFEIQTKELLQLGKIIIKSCEVFKP